MEDHDKGDGFVDMAAAMLPRMLPSYRGGLRITDYAAALEARDMPSAVAIWDELAQAIRDHVVREAGDRFNPRLPPVLSSFMPKSGGTFLHNRLISALGYQEFFWGIPFPDRQADVLPTDAALRIYLEGGVFCHSHAVPSPYFRMVVMRHRTGPIWVHVRHPAEACLAAYFHMKGEGQGQGAVLDERLAGIARLREDIRAAHGFVMGDWPAFFHSWIGFLSGWIRHWLSFAREYPDRVCLTYFDELSDVPALLTRVFRAHGHDLPPVVIEDELPHDRRRRGGQRDWREGLTAEDIARHAAELAVWDEVMAYRAGDRGPPATAG